MCGAPGCNHEPQTTPSKNASRNWQGPFRKTPGRLFGMAFIRLYQLTFSGFIGNSCRHIPTCSEYGYEAIARHGFWAGGWLTLFRVARCGPGGTSGLDPVRETLGANQHWWAPWRYWSRRH
ncbi:membrane protein insertion efficiency factor YidD [Agrobacterium sp.]|uniref:membrane protein insertion efficiency factor YidD n=1 Tax=Agrobacterium sp. TaxID=361 RepID=UPI0028A8EE76|nr:membrane protein insertion efficiency factor YidD [Agrobacterium sp.]